MNTLNTFLSTFDPSFNLSAIVSNLNLTHPDSVTYRAHIAIGICVPVITAVYLSRVVGRWVDRVWGVEEWLVLIAWIGIVANFGLIGASVSNEADRNGWKDSDSDSDSNARSMAYWIYIATIEYGVTVCVTKLWILWVYRRAFSARTIFNALATILVVVLVGFYSSVTLVQIFECTPREKIFNSTVPGRCVNRDVLFDIVDSFNTITDFLVLSLPTREAWELEGSKTKKVLVVCLFTFGICAPIFSAIRFAVRVGDGGRRSIWTQPEVLLWGAAELTVGIICACAPDMAALYERARYKLRNASILRVSTADRLRRLEGNDNLETCSPEGNPYGSRVSVLQSEFGLEQQVSGTVANDCHDPLG